MVTDINWNQLESVNGDVLYLDWVKYVCKNRSSFVLKCMFTHATPQ